MGDIGIDKWCWMMDEHKRKGDNIIQYNEMDDEKSVNKIERGLFLKDRRAAFWERHHSIPTTNDLIYDLIWQENEVKA